MTNWQQDIERQIEDMLQTALNLEGADFVGCAVLAAAIRDWRDSRKALLDVAVAAERAAKWFDDNAFPHGPLEDALAKLNEVSHA